MLSVMSICDRTRFVSRALMAHRRSEISDCKPITNTRANLSLSNHNYISTFDLSFTSVNLKKDVSTSTAVLTYRTTVVPMAVHKMCFTKLMILGEMFCCLLVRGWLPWLDTVIPWWWPTLWIRCLPLSSCHTQRWRRSWCCSLADPEVR